MGVYKSELQEKWMDEVYRLHYVKGYSAGKISKIIPVSEITVWRWIRIFAAEKSTRLRMKRTEQHEIGKMMGAYDAEDFNNFQARIKELEKALEQAEFEARAWKHMIDVAESMGMPVRKKVGTKQ